MNVIKISLHNKMEEDILTNALMFCIERDKTITFSTNSITDNFQDLKKSQVSFL